MMKYFSTFSGIGGFELGIGDRGECVGFSEIDKYATAIYQKHFPSHKNYGDITRIVAEDLPDFDLLVGGFPCQAFSIAGKRRGFEDTRGTMFFELARILRAKKPRLFVFENVKGLLNHDGGKTFKTIIAAIDELGYDCQWQVLNSKNHGVPQNRERVFIVGHSRGTPRPEVFPLGADDRATHNLQGHVSNTLTARYHGGEATGTCVEEGEFDAQEVRVVGDMAGEKWERFHESSRRVYGVDGISPTVPTSAGGGHIPKINVRDIEESLAFEGLEITEKGYEVLDRINKMQRIRRLTPTECERLQGFPDGWTDSVSDTQRYKTLGNAVTVNVIDSIMSRLI
jgi:DNA (cytosine-5)-methyltransferase 1